MDPRPETSDENNSFIITREDSRRSALAADMPENGLVHLLAHRGFGIDPGKAAALPRAQDEIADHGGIHGQATEEKLLLGRNGLLPGVGLEIRIMGVRHGKAPASSP
ncbi:MAG: hypothetical protein ACLSHC_05265 [Bilophila wadsworthia]